MPIPPIGKEAQAVFNKYTHNYVMRLKKPEAVKMFVTDYKLSDDHASLMFDIFDIDKNGELSIWEYQQFYATLGTSVHEVIGLFNKVQRSDGSGNVDMDRTWEEMKEVKTMSGRVLTDPELEQFLRNGANENKEIDIRRFINVMVRIKTFRG
ncbi:uncharacterized protein LOC110463371 isoform X2 [Mizuhopecten yessoensis]|uniref:uncharacterized protein LOC110463371 isoform X2 n=1 Tax=Mizuhopecten yessoensis TaxID=6573 RepID=UPI000B45E35C|nr:uncharacterized protein LOC110463371 isoform X2 [Mizuhopecten yessoensis]